MKFRTEINIRKAPVHIEHKDKILTLGSCFADNMARRLQEHFFTVFQNPFGTLYNPLSVAEALSLIMEGRQFSTDDLFFYQGQWHSFWHHSTFSQISREAALQKINTQIEKARSFLKEAQWLILTFGTAFAYFHLPENRLVANCHKLPEKQFERRLIDQAQIVRELQTLFKKIRRFNPDLNIILTVSPVRHLRDGLVGNARSKAALILAVQTLCENDPELLYFPAYEIVNDDLRDYRFYDSDLTHPNDLAVDYIYEKFAVMFFEPETTHATRAFARLSAALNHRPQNPLAPDYRKFLLKTLDQIETLKQRYPYVDLHRAKEEIERRLREIGKGEE